MVAGGGEGGGSGGRSAGTAGGGVATEVDGGPGGGAVAVASEVAGASTAARGWWTTRESARAMAAAKGCTAPRWRERPVIGCRCWCWGCCAARVKRCGRSPLRGEGRLGGTGETARVGDGAPNKRESTADAKNRPEQTQRGSNCLSRSSHSHKILQRATGVCAPLQKRRSALRPCRAAASPCW